MSDPLLSVVVARSPGTSGSDRAAPWLKALYRSCEGIDSEILLVGFEAGSHASSEAVGAPVVMIDATGSLTPHQWGAGLAAARGRYVAFTTDLCTVDTGWARAIVAALQGGATAVGGPIRPAPDLSPTGMAVFTLRFGRLPTAGEQEVTDVAADNAGYVRSPLLEHAGSLARGFWEVEANHRLRAHGHRLVFSGTAGATFTGGESFVSLLRQRFLHGRQAGAWRIAAGARRRWQVLLAWPLVPLVLLRRSARSTTGRASVDPRMVPSFLGLATAWALGEATGALIGPPAR